MQMLFLQEISYIDLGFSEVIASSFYKCATENIWKIKQHTAVPLLDDTEICQAAYTLEYIFSVCPGVLEEEVCESYGI